jgi:Leucine-rich repeat (LRR) protein
LDPLGAEPAPSLGDPIAQSSRPGDESSDTAARLRLLNAFPNLEALTISATSVRPEDIARIDAAPKLMRLDLSRARLQGRVAPLRALHRLQSLSLSHTKISNTDLDLLNSLGGLRQLDLSHTCVSDVGLTFVAALPELRRLNLSETNVTGSGLRHLAGSQHLTILQIDKHEALDETGNHALDQIIAILGDSERSVEQKPRTRKLDLQSLPVMEVLSTVTLANAILDEESFKVIASQPNLRVLDLSGSNIEDAWLRHLATSKLESLSLSNTRISRTGLTTVARIQGLVTLRIENVRISAQDLRCLGRMELHSLTLNGLKDAKEAVLALSELHSLECLRIAYCQLNDDDVSVLSELPNLRILDVEGNNVRPPSLRRINGRHELARDDVVQLEL